MTKTGGVLHPRRLGIPCSVFHGFKPKNVALLFPVFVTFLEENFYPLVFNPLAIELLVIWVTRRIFVPCLSTNLRINPALPVFASSKNGDGTTLWLRVLAARQTRRR